MGSEPAGQRSFGQLLDAGFGIYFRHFRELAGIAAVVLVPVGILTFGLDLISASEEPGGELYQFGDEVRAVDESLLLTIQAVEALIITIAYLVVTGAATLLASAAHDGRAVDARSSLRAAGRRIGSLLWLSLLFGLAVALSAIPALLVPLLLVLPIYVFVSFTYAVPVLMVEDVRGRKALSRSFDLIQKFWWRTLGALVVVALFVVLFYGVVPALVIEAAGGLSTDSLALFLLLNVVLSIGGAILTAPLWAVVVVVMYYDLRIRKEGYDLERLVGEIHSEGPPPAPAAPAGPAQEPRPGPTPSTQPPPSTPPPPPGSDSVDELSAPDRKSRPV